MWSAAAPPYSACWWGNLDCSLRRNAGEDRRIDDPWTSLIFVQFVLLGPLFMSRSSTYLIHLITSAQDREFIHHATVHCFQLRLTRKDLQNVSLSLLLCIRFMQVTILVEVNIVMADAVFLGGGGRWAVQSSRLIHQYIRTSWFVTEFVQIDKLKFQKIIWSIEKFPTYN